MWSRFQIGSNSPLAKRSASRLSTDSLPRKWSMRKMLRLVEDGVERGVERLRRREVGAERLLGDHAGAGGQPGGAEHGDDAGRRRRRDGEVEQPAGLTADRLLGGLDRGDQGAGVGGVGGTEVQRRLERRPGIAGRRGEPEVGDGVAGVLAELLVGERELRRRRPDDAVPRRHQPRRREVEQAREELALGQVAGGPEDDDDVVVGDRKALGSGGAHRQRLRPGSM